MKYIVKQFKGFIPELRKVVKNYEQASLVLGQLSDYYKEKYFVKSELPKEFWVKLGLENCYGEVSLEKEDGKYFWSLESHSSCKKQEIPKAMFDEMLKYGLERITNTEPLTY